MSKRDLEKVTEEACTSAWEARTRLDRAKRRAFVVGLGLGILVDGALHALAFLLARFAA